MPILFFNCQQSGGSSGGGGGGGITPLTFDTATNPGDVVSITVGSEAVEMIYASNRTSITFPIGPDDSGIANINRRFFIAETEVTNAVFAVVYQWAYDNGKFSDNVGNHNGIDGTTAKYGTQQLINLNAGATCKISFNPINKKFSVASGYKNHPAVHVSWYGVIMFCNWLTEMKDRNATNLVYSGIDTTWDHNEIIEVPTKKGYRLPSIDEWEYTARYRGSDTTNTVVGYSNPNYTKGNSASNATTYYNDVTGAPNYEGKLANDIVAVYGGYWNGSLWVATGVTEVAVVVSKVSGANTLGLYDMSGNVWEWCYNLNGANRAGRGGGWINFAFPLQVGVVDYSNPNSENNFLGFRISRTK